MGIWLLVEEIMGKAVRSSNKESMQVMNPNNGGVSVIGSCNGFLYGFGYDSVADDYKFVWVLQLISQETGLSYSELLIYSLKSDSWIKVFDDVPIHFCSLCAGVFLKEHLHWVNLTNYNHTLLPIVSFNLSTHGFGEVPVAEIEMSPDTVMHAEVLDGCLSIFVDHEDNIEIFVMKEYGVSESWTKLFRITKATISDTIDRIIAFNTLLVELCYYWVKTLVMEDVSSVDSPCTKYDPCVRVENLLMLDHSTDFLKRRNVQEVHLK
ncbi:F-box protein CPR1-like [Spinacia oleracea]|uniref:F-box protein CPR1-like n=1 Tax=Spinacia oleracea TaxID=3562 RepID=A0ABM3QR34_SPIOL|nr:F-box protein CPR1-like [Spinacia oleracea]